MVRVHVVNGHVAWSASALSHPQRPTWVCSLILALAATPRDDARRGAVAFRPLSASGVGRLNILLTGIATSAAVSVLHRRQRPPGVGG